METIITEYESPARFDCFLEPLPIVPPDVLRRRAENHTKGRTLRLIRRHGVEAVRQQYASDLRTVAKQLDTLMAKMADWDEDFLLDMRRWVNRQMAKNQHHLLELLAAAEVLNEAKQAALDA
ncbi:MAG TPA: hypothetical protein VMR25_12805 [Planctomycetaceae bacterium]|nr:hypothetical protein [Planctomycetaceae bacterium]